MHVLVSVRNHYGGRGLEHFEGTPATVRAALVARFSFLGRPDHRGHDLMELVEYLNRCQAYSAALEQVA